MLGEPMEPGGDLISLRYRATPLSELSDQPTWSLNQEDHGWIVAADTARRRLVPRVDGLWANRVPHGPLRFPRCGGMPYDGSESLSASSPEG